MHAIPIPAGAVGRQRRLPVLGAAAMALAVVMGPALAQEQPADVAAYCTRHFGTDALDSVDRRDNGPLCTIRSDGGLGLRHHKIDPADVCTDQNDTSRYRREGPAIICLTGSGTGEPNPDRTVDLGEYCRSNYGEAAIVSRRLTDNQPLCTVKGDGGLSQTHHAVDVAGLCGGSRTVAADAVEDDVLDCAVHRNAADRGDSGRPGQDPAGAPAGGGNSASRQPSDESPSGQVPETAIIPIADMPDLAGCGFIRSAVLEDLTAGTPDPPTRWEVGAATTPCPALTGGFRPDLNAFCDRHAGGMTAGVLGDGRPICHPSGYFPRPNDAGGYWMVVAAVCSQMYPNQDDMARGEPGPDGTLKLAGRLVPVLKFKDGVAECFYIDLSTGDLIDDLTGSMD